MAKEHSRLLSKILDEFDYDNQHTFKKKTYYFFSTSKEKNKLFSIQQTKRGYKTNRKSLSKANIFATFDTLDIHSNPYKIYPKKKWERKSNLSNTITELDRIQSSRCIQYVRHALFLNSLFAYIKCSVSDPFVSKS